jgi:hypothetical protein
VEAKLGSGVGLFGLGRWENHWLITADTSRAAPFCEGLFPARGGAPRAGHGTSSPQLLRGTEPAAVSGNQQNDHQSHNSRPTPKLRENKRPAQNSNGDHHATGDNDVAVFFYKWIQAARRFPVKAYSRSAAVRPAPAATGKKLGCAPGHPEL